MRFLLDELLFSRRDDVFMSFWALVKKKSISWIMGIESWVFAKEIVI